MITQQLSPFFSITIDDSIDVVVLKELVIYARYITSAADIKTSFSTMRRVKPRLGSEMKIATVCVCQ